MSGYKRVNFYELCRLCATNQQKEKTHIFQEEGRKIQLQTKIQSCLSLKVCENDFLPKVVCSQCLRSLEECYTFRNECVSSETMLSSYFNNFRYTEDFKKSGKVYIKDTTPTPKTEQPDPEYSPANSMSASLNTVGYENVQKEYFPAPVQPETKVPKPEVKTSHSVAYNLSTINFAALKGIVQGIPKGEAINNIAVNSSGEIVNITPLLDLEGIIMQNNIQKSNKVKTISKRHKIETNRNENLPDNLVQIDLNQALENGVKYEKVPHVKSMQSNKYTYTIKIEDGKHPNVNQPVVLNQVSNISLPIGNNAGNFNQGNYNGISNSSTVNNLTVPNPLSNWNFSTVANSNASTVNIVSGSVTTNPSVINTNMGNGGNVSQSVYTNGMNNWNLVNGANEVNSGCLNTPTVGLNHTGLNVNVNVTASPLNSNEINSLNKVSYGKKNIEATPSPDTKQDISGKSFPCDVCQKVFKRREHLHQHVKLHTGFRPFVCENCNKSFMRKEHLMRHMTSHSGLKNFTCTTCDKSFSRNDNLLKHKKTHEKQTSFTCEVCQKQFVMKHYYQAHKLTHDNEKCQVPLWNILKT